jgi:hypothetical protein
VRSPTVRNTTRTPCPGDCAPPFASRDGWPTGPRSRMRREDCSARTCRMPACTQPEQRLTESANGSVASWRCYGPDQVSRGARSDDGDLAESGNRVIVPAPEAPAAVALIGLERENGDDGGGPQELGSMTSQKPLVRDSDGHPSGGLQGTGDPGPISYPGRLLRAHVERPLARASGIAADCDGYVLSKRRRTMARDNSRPPRRP